MKSKKLVIFITILLIVSLIPINTFASEILFSDVSLKHWAKESIDYFAEKGIINGYNDGTFKPSNGVTREEFCKLLVLSFGSTISSPSKPTFSDVKENRWSYKYIETCSSYLNGYNNNLNKSIEFRPTEYAKREDIAAALVRIMGYTKEDVGNSNNKFSDINSISSNLLPYVNIASEKGLISGYPDGTFRPTQGITRAETVVLLKRALSINSNKKSENNINNGINYTINKIDQSISEKLNGKPISFESYYDLVVVKGEDELFNKINAQLNKGYADYLDSSKDIKKDFYREINAGYDDIYCCCSVDTEVTQNDNNIFSVKHTSYLYDSGGGIGDVWGETYSTKDGTKLNIAEVLGVSEDVVEEYIDNTILKEVNDNKNVKFFDSAFTYTKDHDLDDINFYVKNDDIFLCFRTYEIACRADGNFIFKLIKDNSCQ